MEQARKQLKLSSLFLLLFAGLSVIQLGAELLFGELNSATIPEGAPENILLITKIILSVLTILILLPQIYVGLKGLKFAKNPDSSKGHIVWAIILFVISVLYMISPVANIIKGGDASENIKTIASYALEAIIYFEYIHYARALIKN